jgi:hypothetical protein
MTMMASGTLTTGEVGEFADRLAASTGELTPESLDAEHAAARLAQLGRLQRVTQAAIALLAKRLDDTQAWKPTPGVSSAAQLVARELGTSVAQAKQAIETVQKLEWLAETKSAFVNGEISQAQAAAIVPAALAAPGSESDLLERAASVPLKKLQETCSEVELRADTSGDGQSRRRHKTYARSAQALDAMWRLEALGPNEQAAEIKAVWDCFTDRAFRQARGLGRRETHDQYAWDGLVAMARAAKAAANNPKIRITPIRPRIIVRVDATALKTDRVAPGEVCEIPGVGPVDIAAAKRLLPDGMLDFIVAEGVDVKSVAHGRRNANITQLVALWSREYVCEIEGCEAREFLQMDHIDEYGRCKRTCATRLGWKCPRCHDRNTNRGYRDGPLQPNGRRKLIAPTERPPPHDTG